MTKTKYVNGKLIKYNEELPPEPPNAYANTTYEELVAIFIREKYTLDDELAIHRQKETKPDEWEAYFAYCEDCKNKAKKLLEVENE